MAENRKLDVEAIGAAVTRLLDEHPKARVAACDKSGIYVDMPGAVPLRGQQLLRTRMYEMVTPDYRIPVFDGWRRTRNHGGATVPVHLLDGEPATFYFIDSRDLYGVLLAIMVPGLAAADELRDIDPDLPARSRFGRAWRNDLGRVVRMDDAAVQLLGWTADDLKGREATDMFHPDDHELAFENWIEALSSPGVPRRWRGRHRSPDGSWLWIEITNTAGLPGVEPLVLSEMMDISDEMDTLERLREREELLHRLAESLPSGIVQVDTDLAVVYTNKRLHEILGVGPNVTLRDQFGTTSLDDRPRLAAAVDRVMSTGVDVDIDLRLDRHDQSQQRVCQLTVRALRDGVGKVSGAVITVEDITESTMLRRELERRANIDQLTACFNRTATMSELERLLDQRIQADLGTAVVFIDLDDFKPINDRLGHAAGDVVLAEAADRLRLAVRAQDLVGRLGGDEFLVVCPGLNSPETAVRVAERILGQLVAPVLVGDEEVALTASIGVAWSVNDETTADRLVARADAAMYDAKHRRDGTPVLAAALVL